MKIERSWKAICAATLLALTLTAGTALAARKKGAERPRTRGGAVSGQHRGARGQGPGMQRSGGGMMGQHGSGSMGQHGSGGTMGHGGSNMGQHENDDMGQHQRGGMGHDSGNMEQQHGGGMMEKD